MAPNPAGEWVGHVVSLFSTEEGFDGEGCVAAAIKDLVLTTDPTGAIGHALQELAGADAAEAAVLLKHLMEWRDSGEKVSESVVVTLLGRAVVMPVWPEATAHDLTLNFARSQGVFGHLQHQGRPLSPSDMIGSHSELELVPVALKAFVEGRAEHVSVTDSRAGRGVRWTPLKDYELPSVAEELTASIAVAQVPFLADRLGDWRRVRQLTLAVDRGGFGHFCDTGVATRSFTSLFNGMEKLRDLQGVHLDFSQAAVFLNDDGFNRLAVVCPGWTKLQSFALIVDESPVTDEGVSKVMTALAQLPKLSDIELSFKSCRNLTSYCGLSGWQRLPARKLLLDFAGCEGIVPGAMARLSGEVGALQSLDHLELRFFGNGHTAADATSALANALKKLGGLRHFELEFAFCQLELEDVRVLGHAVADLLSLDQFQLDFTGVGTEGAEVLFNALRRSHLNLTVPRSSVGKVNGSRSVNS
eukprot:CAMPEP_0204458178 /NCGR_PEP_ID=MMETSP0471-20130131/3330_1 /ASSEMBLY_ACC=CAM_ASM_000602 /TAXON_ID=2969 /ORGANISM="Oxyrrhis marina" /LENGTH=471 /DNA_ID=CAMNT_0051458757 /DNA_START=25 /DNA_END=1440 /DNA_ORIENTATION=+